MGAAASSGSWGETNWNMRSTYGVNRGGPVSQSFVAGQLYPITILYGNGPGFAYLELDITTPAGVLLTDTTGYFVQPSCRLSGSTIGVSAVDVRTCSATGLEWSVYDNFVYDGSTASDPSYDLFTPNVYNGVGPETAAIRGAIGNIQFSVPAPATAVSLYNQGTFDMSYRAIVFRGYFAANVTGTWTFTINNPDDIGFLWLGPNALTTWSEANANVVSRLLGTAGTYSVSLTAGTLTPIRMVFANGPGGMSYTLQTRDPLGTVRQSTAGFFQQIYCGPNVRWN